MPLDPNPIPHQFTQYNSISNGVFAVAYDKPLCELLLKSGIETTITIITVTLLFRGAALALIAVDWEICLGLGS